jgi:hypothetical protein
LEVIDYAKYFMEIYRCQITELDKKDRSILLKVIGTTDEPRKISSYFKLKRRVGYDKEELLILKQLEEKNLLQLVYRTILLLETQEYILTSCGLFHVLLEVEDYPRDLLLKYRDNIILRTILYPYFELSTIKTSTPSFFYLLRQYIRACCENTVQRNNSLGASSDIEVTEKSIKALETELGWHAKVLGIKLRERYNEKTSDAFATRTGNENAGYETGTLDEPTKLGLSRDNRFLHLMRTVETDFMQGYNELTNKIETQ